MKIRYFSVILSGILLTALCPARADGIFWTVSGDPNNSFVPDQLSSVDLNKQSVTNIATLGDGSLGFNGGLTVGFGGLLYAIANDFTGASSLYSVAANGAITLEGAAGGLGNGFLGGLTWDAADASFYAAALDSSGNTTLYSITPAGVATALPQVLPAAFSGLAYDSANQLFYGIGNDFTGASTLYDFSLGSDAASLGTLGFGFGALSYDPRGDTLWTISPVNNAGAQLFELSPSGVETGPDMTLGDGFFELAVASPEPVSSMELGAGLILLAGLVRVRRRKA